MREGIEAFVEDGVAHEVADRAVADEAGSVKIFAILNANERRDMNRV
jgi:hypothetical protein